MELKGWGCRPLALALLLLTTAPAAADEVEAGGWLEGDTLTGDWGGLRDRLEDLGIELEAAYVGEIAGNPTGGQRQGFRYAHEIEFGASLDLGKLAGLDGTRFHVSFAEYAGHSLSEDRIGNIFAVQEVFDGPADVRLAELSLEQDLLEGGLNLKAGRIAAASDFADIDVACNFQNEAFCDTPAALGENSGFTDEPFASWGGRARLDLGELYLQVGAYEVNPTLSEQGNGFKMGTSGATGVLIPVELGWDPEEGLFGLPGQFRLGGYFDSSDVEDVTAEVDEGAPLRDGRWGLYVLGQQEVYREPGSKVRGLTLFAGAVLGDQHTAELRWFLQGGLSYRGTFAGRDDDRLNLGVAYGHINGRLIDAQKDEGEPTQSAETVIELNYQAAVAGWLAVTPGLQLIVNPGADADVPTAVVLGLKSALEF